MKKNLITLILITIGFQIPVFSSDYYSKSGFKKLPQNEQLKVLKEHKEIQLNKIDSKIKDTNAQIKSLEQNTSISISKKQSMLLKLQQQLTTLNYQRTELVNRYDYKIDMLK